MPTKLKSVVHGILICAAVFAAGSLCPPVIAALVSPVDLFLAPSTIPDDFYDTRSFTFGTNSTVTTFIDASDIGGTLTDVRILPILNPNPSPSSSEGEYTTADLAAIDASNYTTYFFRQPGTGYVADLTSSEIRIDYMASGQHFVEIDAIGPSGAFSKIFHDHVDDFFAEDPARGIKDKGGVSRKITDPSADAILVSDGDPHDNGCLTNVAAHLTNEGTAFTKTNSLAAVKTALENAFNANDMKKISAVLVGHGFGPGNGSPQSGIKIGTEYITNIPGHMTPADFQMMIDPWVNSIEFWSCYTGGDNTFLTDFANSIDRAAGFATTITAAKPSFFGFFSSYFDQGALGKKGVVFIPEPSGLYLLGTAMICVVFRRRAKRHSHKGLLLPIELGKSGQGVNP